MDPFDIDWRLVASNLIHLGVAYLLALPIGWERERTANSAGLRTFPLVAVAVCGYMLIGMSVFADEEARSRVVQGMLTGIGFIGGGVILKNDTNVRGLATAAAIWSTGAVGLAVALGRLEIAMLLAALTFATLRFLEPLKIYIHKHPPGDGKS